MLKTYHHHITQANVQFVTTIGQKRVELIRLMIFDGFRIPVKTFDYE